MPTADDIVHIIAAALGGGGIVALLNWVIAARKAPVEIHGIQAKIKKDEADTSQVITEAAKKALELLERMYEQKMAMLKQESAAEMQSLKTEVVQIKQDFMDLSLKYSALSAQYTVLSNLPAQLEAVVTGAWLLYEQLECERIVPVYTPPKGGNGWGKAKGHGPS